LETKKINKPVASSKADCNMLCHKNLI